MSNVCAHCGAALARGAVACYRCGALLEAAGPSATEHGRVPTALLTSVREQLVGGRWRLVKAVQGLRGATLHAAMDTLLDRPVSVLLLDAALAADPQKAQAFAAETQRFAAFSHPRVAAVLGMGDAGGVPFRVTQHLEGRTLFEHVHARGGRLAFGEASALLGQLTEALRAVHQQGLTHGDVRPASIRVSAEGRLLLSVPAVFDGPPDDAWRSAHEPDTFGAGVIAYELLAGALPPAPLGAELPAPLAEAVRRCLEPAPERRAPGLEALHAALTGAQGSLAGLKLFTQDPAATPAATNEKETTTDRLAGPPAARPPPPSDPASTLVDDEPPPSDVVPGPAPVDALAQERTSPLAPAAVDVADGDTRPLAPAVRGTEEPDTRRLPQRGDRGMWVGLALALPLTLATVWFWRQPGEGAPARGSRPVTLAEQRVPPSPPPTPPPQVLVSAAPPPPVPLVDLDRRAAAFRSVPEGSERRRIGKRPSRSGLKPGVLRVSALLGGEQVEARLTVNKVLQKELTPTEVKLPAGGAGPRALELELWHQAVGAMPVLYTYTAPVKAGLFLEVELDQGAPASEPPRGEAGLPP